MRKGFKVTDVNREKKVGVAVGSYKELIEICCGKFKVKDKRNDFRIFVAEDGTLVDDDLYLETLPAQTLLVFVRPKETMLTDTEFLVSIIRGTHKEYLNAGQNAKTFISTNLKDKFKVFQKLIAKAEDKTTLSLRNDDPEWFTGLTSSENTKEVAMAKRAKERMQGYYYKVKGALENSPEYVDCKGGAVKNVIDSFLLDLRKTLVANCYNSVYFDRNSKKSLRLCTDTGIFHCGGLWNLPTCNYENEHLINPYRSREERIIFQTWNLDHKIELSRSIIPKIKASVLEICSNKASCEECNSKIGLGRVDFEKYYKQIFTKENLKLVHIVCHYKGKHDASTNVFIICERCYSEKYHG